MRPALWRRVGGLTLAKRLRSSRDCGPVLEQLAAASGYEGRQPQPGQPVQVGDAVHRVILLPPTVTAMSDTGRPPDRDQHPGYTVGHHRDEVG
jgi:hypothetical protein